MSPTGELIRNFCWFVVLLVVIFTYGVALATIWMMAIKPALKSISKQLLCKVHKYTKKED